MFVPKISITDIPITADSMIITDITGNTTDATPDTTGYVNGSYAYYPQLKTIWHKFVYAQPIGSLSQQYLYNPPSVKDYTSSAPVSIALSDGVWLVEEYWMRSTTEFTAGLAYTIDASKKILTRTSGSSWVDNGSIPGLFEGLYGISLSEPSASTKDNLKVIDSVSSTTLVLKSELSSGAVSANSALSLWYRTQKYVLVTNRGEQSLISDIGQMALAELQGQGCNNNKSCELANRLMLKLAAQIAFNCGSYVKAHNAAILFNNSSTSPCPDC